MRFSAGFIATTAAVAFLMQAAVVRAEGAEQPPPGVVSASLTTPVMPAASEGAVLPYLHGMDGHTPRVEVFFGYSYLRAVPTLAPGNRLVWLNGGSTSIALNFNRHLGLVGDFGGFDDSQVLLSGVTPSVVVNSSGTVYTYLFGPRLSFRSHERFTPFVQVLFGGARASAVTLAGGCTGLGCTPLPVENKFAMTAGGGLDFKVRHHLAIRLIQAEYLMTSFENHSTGAAAHQNDVRLSTGLVFSFGGSSGPRMPEYGPVTYSCSVNPMSVFQGEAIAVSGTAVNLNPNKTAVYTWSADGGTVAGDGSTAKIDTMNAAPGTYTLKGHVSEGDRAGDSADCTAPYVVKAPEPPTISCSASPVTVTAGDPSTITAVAVSPQNRPLTYSYSATAGAVSGSGTTATLATGGVAAGVVNVTCNAVDDKSQTASAMTPVTVVVPVAAPLPMTSALCSINFDRDVRRPARVDNEGKACLDQVALSLQRSPDAKLAMVGDASGKEKKGSKLAAERATNAKAYLVGEKGIDPSRITVYTGTEDAKGVTDTLIPTGATMDTTGDTPVK